MALRSAGEYVRARWVGEKNTFSPTQSLTRLQSSSSGRSAPPPSQPHAAASAAPAPATPNFTNARLSTSCNLTSWRLGVCPLVMAREPSAVPPRDHRPQRRWVHDEHEYHVSDGERHEQPHGPEVPVAGRLESPEQSGEPAELRGLVDGEPGQHREDAERVDARVGELLERVVLALGRMLLAQPQVVGGHGDGARDVARSEQQGSPLAALHQVAEIEEAGRDEGPHEGEVPVQSPGKPAAEPAPVRELRPVERTREVRPAAVPEAGVRLVDL